MNPDAIFMAFLEFTASVVLAACSPLHQLESVEVDVPVAIPCSAEIPPAPEWASNQLKPTDNIDVKVKKLLAERAQHFQYESELMAATDGCR